MIQGNMDGHVISGNIPQVHFPHCPTVRSLSLLQPLRDLSGVRKTRRPSWLPLVLDWALHLCDSHTMLGHWGHCPFTWDWPRNSGCRSHGQGGTGRGTPRPALPSLLSTQSPVYRLLLPCHCEACPCLQWSPLGWVLSRTAVLAASSPQR